MGDIPRLLWLTRNGGTRHLPAQAEYRCREQPNSRTPKTMYTPPAFREDDPDALRAMIREARLCHPITATTED